MKRDNTLFALLNSAEALSAALRAARPDCDAAIVLQHVASALPACLEQWAGSWRFAEWCRASTESAVLRTLTETVVALVAAR